MEKPAKNNNPRSSMKKIVKKKNIHSHDEIIEKQLGIPPDYQYKALHNSNFLQSNWHSNKLTALEENLAFNKNISVLDLGSGSGNFELLFSKKVKGITAVDYHQEALDFLSSMLKKQKIKNVTLVHSDIRDLTKVSNFKKYDIIILIDVIEHIQKKEASAMIKVCKKLLSPGGKICVITPNYKSLWLHIEHILDHFTIVPHFGGHQHLAQYYPDNLNELFKSNGFKATRVKTFNFISFLSPLRIISSILTKIELKSNMRFGNLLLGVFENEKK